MRDGLGGKTALVTGGTRGIGRSIAETLLSAGVRVAICAKSGAGIETAVREMAAEQGAAPGQDRRVAGKPCNVGVYEEVAALFRFIEETFGGLDILVNNAGIGWFEPVDQIAPERWRELIATNLSGVFYCTREAAPLMRKRGGGYIINIGSLAGKNALPGGAAYNASKFGLVGLSEATMLDLRHDNIRVTYVMPGSVATEFGGHGGEGTDWKVLPEHIAEVVLDLLRLPGQTMASRVEVRPTRPPRR